MKAIAVVNVFRNTVYIACIEHLLRESRKSYTIIQYYSYARYKTSTMS